MFLIPDLNTNGTETMPDHFSRDTRNADLSAARGLLPKVMALSLGGIILFFNPVQVQEFCETNLRNRSAEKILDFENRFGECGHGNGIAAAKCEACLVGAVGGITKDQKQIVFEILDPDLGNSR